MINYRTESGRLIFTADNESRADLAAAIRENGHAGALSLVLEETGGNGLEMVPPERIFALTDMPLFSESFLIEDDDSSSIAGPLYGFSEYWRVSEWARLRDTGRVEFETVATFPDSGWAFPDPYSQAGLVASVQAFRGCNDADSVIGRPAE